jgi:predicted dehydrogenase
MQSITIGLIGAGQVVDSRHLPGLEPVPDVRVSHVWSRTRQRATALASAHGIDRVVDDWRHILDADEVDAVIVAAPPVLHAEATVAALDAGKHVLCQGRMARNLQEARQMHAAAADSDRVTALYPPRPGLKGDRLVRRLLTAGEAVGEIRDVRVTSMTRVEAPAGYRWMDDPAVVGVNAMALGVWCEVVDRWVGPARRVSAFCASERPVPTRIAVAAELDCGASATYHFSTEAGGGRGNQIAIHGTRGALIYEMFTDELSGVSGDGDVVPIEIPDGEVRLQTTDAEFVAAIRDGTPVAPDFADGVGYMTFCEAVALSCHRGHAVDLAGLQPAMTAWGEPL